MPPSGYREKSSAGLCVYRAHGKFLTGVPVKRPIFAGFLKAGMQGEKQFHTLTMGLEIRSVSGLWRKMFAAVVAGKGNPVCPSTEDYGPCNHRLGTWNCDGFSCHLLLVALKAGEISLRHPPESLLTVS